MLVKHGQLHPIYAVHSAAPIYWSKGRRWRVWWMKALQSMLPALIFPCPLTPSTTRFLRWCRLVPDWSEPYYTVLETARLHRALGNHSNAQWCSTGLRDRRTLVSSFREGPPSCPQMRGLQNMNLHSSLGAGPLLYWGCTFPRRIWHPKPVQISKGYRGCDRQCIFALWSMHWSMWSLTYLEAGFNFIIRG